MPVTPHQEIRADVAVIGAGIIGLTVALRLRESGVPRVVVVESGEPGMQSTGRSAGGIRRQFGTRLEIEMTLAGLPFFERVLADPAFDGRFEKTGYAFLAGRGQVDHLRRAWRLQESMRIPVLWLEGDELQRRFPYCDCKPLAGGTFCSEDGFLDPWELVRWLLATCRNADVVVRKHTPVIGIDVDDGRVRSIRAEGLTVVADRVVVAAGAWTGSVAMLAGVSVPVTPSPRVKLVTHRQVTLPHSMPLVIDLLTGAYVRCEQNGRAIVGVTPASPVTSFDLEPSFDAVAAMAERAAVRFPSLADAQVTSLIKGLYEITPDGLPLAGPVADVSGLYVAAGFNGHGIMHGPAVAQALVELMVNGQPRTIDVLALSPERFGSRDHRTQDHVSHLL